MTPSTLVAIVWVFAATGVAMLPMRRQFPPGIILLVAAPVIIIWLGLDHGWLISTAALAAFISMFRNPIRYYWKKWRGLEPGQNPKDPS